MLRIAALWLPVVSAFCDEGICARGSLAQEVAADLAAGPGGAESSEGLQLLHTAATQVRPAGRRASASLDALGRLANVELLGRASGRKDYLGIEPLKQALKSKSRGQALQEAAMAAAALAVAEEAAAARAVGGGPAAQLLASAGHSSKLHGDGATKQAAPHPSKIVSFHEDAGPPGSTAPPVATSSPPASSEPFHPGINPFNPFHNPFFNPFLPNPYAAFSGNSGGGGGGHKLPAVFVVFIVVVVLVVIAGLCNGVFDDEEDESSGGSEDDERGGGPLNRRRRERIQNAVVPGRKTRTCSWCCCGLCSCCSRNVILFFLCALLVTFVGGSALWNSGILQPLLAQLLLFAYLLILVAAFVMLIVWEATAYFRQGFDKFFGQTHQFDGIMGIPFFNKKGAGGGDNLGFVPRY